MLSFGNALVKKTEMMLWTNNLWNPAPNSKAAFSSDQVNDLVIDFTVEQLFAILVVHIVLIARIKEIVAFHHSEAR